MTTSPSLGQPSLIPINNCILVELSQSFSNVRTKDGKYQAYTEGVTISAGTTLADNPELEYLIGKRVFFEEYKEGGHIRRDGKEFAFVKLEDIRGYEDV